MGLLGSLGKYGSYLLDTGITGLKTFETVLQAPIRSIKTIGNQEAFNKLSEEVNAAPLLSQFVKIGASTGAVATAVVGGGAALGAKTAVNIVKAAAPTAITAAKSLVTTAAKNPIKSAVVGLYGVPTALGIIKENPDKAIDIVTSAPSNAYNFGSNIGEFLKDPSADKLKDIATENPFLTAITAGAGLATLGKTILPAAGLKSIFNDNNNNPPAPEKAPETNLPTTNTNDKIKIVEVPSTTTTTPTIPVTPQTQNLSSSNRGAVRRRRRSSTRSVPSINQKVNVIVQQNKTSRTIKNYINREVLLN